MLILAIWWLPESAYASHAPSGEMPRPLSDPVAPLCLPNTFAAPTPYAGAVIKLADAVKLPASVDTARPGVMARTSPAGPPVPVAACTTYTLPAASAARLDIVWKRALEPMPSPEPTAFVGEPAQFETAPAGVMTRTAFACPT